MGDKTMSESSVFVLLATFNPDPDPIPNEIWVFPDQAAAESFSGIGAKLF
jgi:hypothetical protein